MYDGSVDEETGLRSGGGIFVWPTGDKFAGEWSQGQMHGKGTFFWAEGDVYEGQWEMGEMHGEGVKKKMDGSK